MRIAFRVRRQRGSMIVIGLALVFILIPLALVVFDLTMMRQQYNQLKAATDSAALAAGRWISDSENGDGQAATVAANAQKVALPYFRSNRLTTGSQYDGSLSAAESATSDISADRLSRLGQSKLFITYDPDLKRTTAFGEFCVQPTILNFFGLYTLHSKSVVGAGTGIAGDVCFVVDLSASMTLSTPASRNVVNVAPVIKKPLTEKRLPSSTNLIKRFAVPGAFVLNGDPQPDANPNRIVTAKGEGVHPFGAAGFVSFRNLQIPNPHYIDFVPSPNPNLYHSVGTPPQPSIPNSSAPRMKIDQASTPLLYALMNDFAQNKIDVPVPDSVVYPNWPSWPPVNPGKPYTYFDARGAAAPPESHELFAGVNYDGTDPAHMPYDFRTPVKLKTYQNFTIPEMMTVVLLAAKFGILEDEDTFDAAPPESTFLLRQYFPNLGKSIKLQPGYQREYNKLALCNIHAVETQVAIIHDVIDKVNQTNPEAHWSLVGFNAYAAGTANNREASNEQSANPPGVGRRPYDWKLTNPDNGKPMTADMFQIPLVPLDPNRSNAEDVKRVIGESTVRLGTATPQGLKEGINQLNGAGHRNGKSRTLVLMTDGLPTQGGSLAVVKPSKKKGTGLGNINLVIVGLFEGGYACPGGPNFCTKLAKAAGENATVYPVNKLTKNCGKVAGNPGIDLSGDAIGISKFIVSSIGGAGDLGLIE